MLCGEGLHQDLGLWVLLGEVAAEDPVGWGSIAGVWYVKDEGDMAGLDEWVRRGFDGRGEDAERIVPDELLEDGDTALSMDSTEIHYG